MPPRAGASGALASRVEMTLACRSVRDGRAKISGAAWLPDLGSPVDAKPVWWPYKATYKDSQREDVGRKGP